MKTPEIAHLCFARIYDWFFPSILFYRNPFRICEYLALTKAVVFKKTDVVLDLGCGVGVQTYCMGRRVKRIVGIDVRPIHDAYRDHHRVAGIMDISFRSCRLQDAGYETASFDKIFSFCVIEHIPEYKEVLAECFRILKPGGQIHLSADSLKTIHDRDLLEKHRVDHAVVKYFEPDEMRALLGEAGFSDVEVSPLFRGKRLARLFAAGIKAEFKYERIQSWLLAVYIYMCDLFTGKHEDGVFLEVHACKPFAAPAL